MSSVFSKLIDFKNKCINKFYGFSLKRKFLVCAHSLVVGCGAYIFVSANINTFSKLFGYFVFHKAVTSKYYRNFMHEVGDFFEIIKPDHKFFKTKLQLQYYIYFVLSKWTTNSNFDDIFLFYFSYSSTSGKIELLNHPAVKLLTQVKVLHEIGQEIYYLNDINILYNMERNLDLHLFAHVLQGYFEDLLINSSNLDPLKAISKKYGNETEAFILTNSNILYYCRRRRHFFKMRYILQLQLRHRIDVNKRNNFFPYTNHTPYSYALLDKYFKMCRLLLCFGATPEMNEISNDNAFFPYKEKLLRKTVEDHRILILLYCLCQKRIELYYC